MKEKIKKLFKQYYNDETMPVIDLEDKVLALFDVVGQREQLNAFKIWHLRNFGNTPISMDELNEYIESI